MDAELNLVPFIDMMSCLLSFLMLTVVWNRLAKIDIDNPLPKASTAPATPQDPPKDIAMFVDHSGFAIMVANDDPVKPFVKTPIILLREADGQLPFLKLKESLAGLQKALPEKEIEDKDEKGKIIKKSVKHNSIIIGARNGIRYDDIVGTMDEARGLGLEGIVINMETDSPMIPLVAAIGGGKPGG